MSFQWSEDISVNVRRFDYQHQKLLELFDQIGEQISHCSEFSDFDYLFEELREYANYHFQSEEKVLKDANYPHIGKQIIHHNNFLKKIDEFRGKFACDKDFIGDDVKIFLRNWFYHHVKTVDKQYGDFLNALDIF
ncbi:Bacteriohemerythrin [Candidatus Lokiarchaeum ossiferum]|uniref:Bacteriohemerythrin n=1 Tax=Candidatus Lokiarchaeum ossiferum TaxID=2951803 RepID=A0ABY6HYP4_9ARCH|nr:Bacteriohemerythrin [Candidatus Lokiarchaeum sp. B-35]